MMTFRFWQRCSLLVIAVVLSGCETLGYYSQAVAGQWQLWHQRQPIGQLLVDEAIDPLLKKRLSQIQAIREFASKQLFLPDNNSYRFYVDIARPYVVWNVFAAPAFSVEPKQWCFPVAGCVSYRGYFSEQAALAYADKLAAEGYDTYVGGITAYSTLGWFDDPVLNTFIDRDEVYLAGLIFHELAHQQLYIPGDTRFNESFARAVEIAGVSLWLQHSERLKQLQIVDRAPPREPGQTSLSVSEQAKNNRRQLRQYLQHQQINDDFVAMVLTARQRLSRLYQQGLSAEAMHASKGQIIEAIKQQHYPEFKQRWHGITHYDEWVNDGGIHRALNNAKLATVASYQQWLPAFQQLLRDERGDMPRFYQRVKALAKLGRVDRVAALEQLSAKR